MSTLNKIIKNKKFNYPPKNVAPKQLMVLLYMVYEGLANGFKTMCEAS